MDMKYVVSMRMRRALPWAVGICLLAAGAARAGVEPKVFASGLQGPHGVGIHPLTREVYVTEMKKEQVSVIRGGRPVTVVPKSGWKVEYASLPRWAVAGDYTEAYWLRGELTKPGAVAITTNDHIIVCEHREGGRILEFIPDENGQYLTARLICVPWLDRPFLWDDIKVARDGRVFLAGADPTQKKLHFGSVMMRDTDGEWWVVDYGPFMNFCGLYLSNREDVLVVCNKEKGELVWWDTERHLPIGMAEQTMEAGAAEDVALMPDGSFIVAKQSADGEAGQLIRVSPTTEEKTVLFDRINRIGSVVLDRTNDLVFVSDEGKGSLHSLKMTGADSLSGSGEYLLKRSLDGYRMAEGFTPRKAPTFLKNFFSKVGQELIEEKQDKGTMDIEVKRSVADSSFTLREFANHIPLVAGRIKTNPERVNQDIANPLVSIDFVVMFPGLAVQGGENASPSMNYFLAMRKDGHIEQTKVLFPEVPMMKRGEDQWQKSEERGALSIPISTCGMEKNDNGVTVNLAFLGVGIYDDYYLNLSAGIENSGTIIVETKNGERETYRAVFEELASSGSEEAEFIVAGFDPMQKSNIGWLNIGRWPVGAAIETEHKQVPNFSGVSETVHDMIEKKNLEWRVESGKQSEEVEEFEE